MSDSNKKKQDTLKKGEKLVADDGSGVEIKYAGPKNEDGEYLVEIGKRGKESLLKRMTSATMHDDSTLDIVKDILNKESKNVPFQVGRFTVTQGPVAKKYNFPKKTAAKKPAAKKSQGGKRRKTKRRKRRRKRKTRRRSRKRKRRTRRRRR